MYARFSVFKWVNRFNRACAGAVIVSSLNGRFNSLSSPSVSIAWGNAVRRLALRSSVRSRGNPLRKSLTCPVESPLPLRIKLRT
ncbi:hypothetical protein D9M71_628580 [compost metagenome]